MIDTIILRIKEFDFQIKSHEAFTPNCLGFFRAPYTPFNGQTNLKAVQNPTKLDRQQKNYKPRLTVIKRIGRQGGFDIELRIEFSVPKLLCGNNFQEVDEKDFDSILSKLQAKLREMWVSVSVESLRQANVATIHYSKNFCFTDHTTASALISDISKVDLTRRLDLNKTDFRNEGKALYYYAQSHSLVFYDKVQDLIQPGKRASEKDGAFNWQRTIFDEIRRKQAVPLEVLRMELRLCDRRKMKALLKYLNLEAELTFEGLFKKEIAQTALLDYWSKIHEEVRVKALMSRKPQDLLEAIFKIPDLTLQKSLTLFAILEISKTSSDRKLYNMIQKRFCARTFQRLKKFVAENESVLYDRYTAYDAIYNQLMGFQPVTEEDYLKLMR